MYKSPEEHFRHILHTIDRSFDAGNRENFILNEFLLVISIFLMFLVGLHFMEARSMIIVSHETKHLMHTIELFFGIVFLIEFLFRTVYVYIPDKKFFDPYTIVSFLVIISLVLPQFFNIAFLRLIWVIKMFKIYHMRRVSHSIIAQNPSVTQKLKS